FSQLKESAMNIQQEVSAVIAAPIPPPDTWRVLTDGEPLPLGYLMLLEVLAWQGVAPRVIDRGGLTGGGEGAALTIWAPGREAALTTPRSCPLVAQRSAAGRDRSISPTDPRAWSNKCHLSHGFLTFSPRVSALE